jgi:hypothetical protein
MGRPTPESGNPYNIDPKTLRVAPEQGQFHGAEKLANLSPQRAERPIFQTRGITESERVANEKWRAINEKMERFTREQEKKIHLEYFDRLTAQFKPQDFMPENLTPERRIEAAEIFEEIMELANERLLEKQASHNPNTPMDQDTSDGSPSASSR